MKGQGSSTHLPRDDKLVRFRVARAQSLRVVVRHVGRHSAMFGGRRARPTVADGVLRQHPERVVGPRGQSDALVVAVTW